MMFWEEGSWWDAAKNVGKKPKEWGRLKDR